MIYKYLDGQFMFPSSFIPIDSRIIYDEYIDCNLYNTHVCEYEIIKMIDKIHEEY